MGIVYRDQGSGTIVISEDPIATVAVGDSTVRGTSDTGLAYRVTWVGFIPRAYGEVFNQGFDGYTYRLQTARQADWQDLGTASDWKVLHAAMGINDINTGLTAAQIIADIVTFATSARPHFAWMSIQTITSSTFWQNALKHTYWVAVNAWIRANWATYFDYLVDVAADPTYGADDAWQDTAVFEDGTHLTPMYNRFLYEQFYARANAAGRASLGQ